MARVDDARDSEALLAIEQALTKAEYYFRHIEGLGWSLDPRCDLVLDDHALLGVPQSGTVLRLLASATEQLKLLAAEFTDRRLWVFALYSLIRVSIELSATVIWLIGPDEEEVRRMRRLRLELAAVNDYRNAVNDMSTASEQARGRQEASEREKQISRIAKENGYVVEDVKQISVKSSVVIGEASSRVVAAQPGDDKSNPHWYRRQWASASGFAHGRSWAHAIFGETISFEADDDGQAKQGLTLSVVELQKMLDAALMMMWFASDRYEKRTRSPANP